MFSVICAGVLVVAALAWFFAPVVRGYRADLRELKRDQDAPVHH